MFNKTTFQLTILLFSFNAFASLDANNQIIPNSIIEANDINVRFQQVFDKLTERNLPFDNSSLKVYKGREVHGENADTFVKNDLLNNFSVLPSYLNISQPTFSDTISSTELNTSFNDTISLIESGSIAFTGSYNTPTSVCDNPCGGTCSVTSTLLANSCSQTFNGLSTGSIDDAQCLSSINESINSPAGSADKTAGLSTGTISETYTCSEGQDFSTGTLTSVTCDTGYVEDNLSCVISNPLANIHVQPRAGGGFSGVQQDTDLNIYPISDLISSTEQANLDFANNGNFFNPVIDPTTHSISLFGFEVNSGTLSSGYAIDRLTGVGFFDSFSDGCMIFGLDSSNNPTRNQIKKSSNSNDNLSLSECKAYASELYKVPEVNILEQQVVLPSFGNPTYTLYYVDGQDIINPQQYLLKDLITPNDPVVSFYDVLYGLENTISDPGSYLLLKYKDNLFPSGRFEPVNQSLRISDDNISFVSGDLFHRSLLYTNIPYSGIDVDYGSSFGAGYTGCFINHDAWPQNGQMYTYRIEKTPIGSSSRIGDIGDIECNQVKEVLNKVINSKSSVTNNLGRDVEASKASIINGPPITFE